MAASESLPTFVAPMLLTTTGEVPTHKAWALEVKWDGMRAQLVFDGRRVSLRSRRGRECGAQFPELEALASVLPAQAVFDGELVCFDADGRAGLRTAGIASARSDRRRPTRPESRPAALVLFDVLHWGGQATRQEAYRDRRALLDDLALNGPAWRTPRSFAVDDDLVTVTRDLHLEGIVAKRLDAPYRAGRRSDRWLTTTATASG